MIVFALEIVRKIETKSYNYRDYINRGKNIVVGFIAQNVKEHFPDAVNMVTRFIPNVMKNITNLEVLSKMIKLFIKCQQQI